jgi:aerobic-type carbon monoxide dehydrogenase small subunit (CoxS/CutS family)
MKLPSGYCSAGKVMAHQIIELLNACFRDKALNVMDEFTAHLCACEICAEFHSQFNTPKSN